MKTEKEALDKAGEGVRSMKHRLHGKAKLKRNLAIIRFEFKHPYYTLKELGEKFCLDASTISCILSNNRKETAVDRD